MKQSDIISIILIATVGMLVAFFAGNAIMGNPDLESVSFNVVDPVISSNLIDPDPELFNEEAINPTVEVTIGECEDLNGNGLLDADERKKCLNMGEDEENEDDVEVEVESEDAEDDGVVD